MGFGQKGQFEDVTGLWEIVSLAIRAVDSQIWTSEILLLLVSESTQTTVVNMIRRHFRCEVWT